MAATKLWYPHYIRDFKAKTGHLSLAERGAYRALIDEYWENQGPICADERKLCRMIGAFPDEWEDVRDAVLAFFEVVDGKLVHGRIDEEIEKAVSTHEAKKERIAKARAAKQKKKSDADSVEDSSDYNSVDSPVISLVDRAFTELNTSTPTPSPSPTHVTNVTQEPREARKRAARLPEGWVLPDDWRPYAEQRGLDPPSINRLAEEMYTWSRTSPKGAKREWHLVWQNWVRRKIDDEKTNYRSNRAPGDDELKRQILSGAGLAG